jgi:hypothetical protein
MIPYLDGGFLLVLLTRTSGTSLASVTLREITPPISINFLHQLQEENVLIRFQKDSDPGCRSMVMKGLGFGTTASAKASSR